ncbi:MAG: hypothetical protein ACKOWN_03910 [Microbacteriaceae bacterium]
MRIRALATITVASALLLGTAGCGVFVETATLKQYSASDGVAANVGDVHFRNLLIVTNEAGDAAIVSSVVNNGSNLEFVNVEVRGATTLSTQVGAYPGLTAIGIADDNPVVFYGAGVVAGEYVDVYVQYGANDGQLVSVPVLDGTDPLYAPYVPEAVEPAVNAVP